MPKIQRGSTLDKFLVLKVGMQEQCLYPRMKFDGYDERLCCNNLCDKNNYCS